MPQKVMAAWNGTEWMRTRSRGWNLAPRLDSDCRDLASAKVRKETVRLRPDPGILGLEKQIRPRVRLRLETGKGNIHSLTVWCKQHTHKGV